MAALRVSTLLAIGCATLVVAPAAHAGGMKSWQADDQGAWLAHVVAATPVREYPGRGKVTWRLKTQSDWNKGSVQLLILDAAKDSRGRAWFKVRLPARPNDSSGWVSADRVKTTPTPWSVKVDISDRTTTIYRKGSATRTFKVVVGAPGTPTPTGLFAIYEKDKQNGGDLGPWALHLTAHSNVLEDFGGGPGRVAMHGRSGDLLSDPLGSAASHGCIRFPNDQISWMARTLPLGTPVRVQR